jgi:TonB family protein
MAFRALVFSKSSDTNSAIAAACAAAGIRAEVCPDIFTAIEKGKTRAFSCVIADWADQPEASFLLKRARESEPNRETVAIGIVEHEPKPAELRDSRLDFLIQRPISSDAATAVLKKACEKMQPMSAEDARELFEENRNVSGKAESAVPVAPNIAETTRSIQTAPIDEPVAAEDYSEATLYEHEPAPPERSSAIGFRGICAALLVLAAGFLLWQSREVIAYLSRTPEGAYQVVKESVAAFFNADKSGVTPVNSAVSDAQQDSSFSRMPGSNAQSPTLGVVATESTLSDEERIPLPKAHDFPLPRPVLLHEDLPPMHVQRTIIPDSMRASAPIERPVVVTVTPAQMMPVSTTQTQPVVQQQVSEPVALSEEAARALLTHIVNPVYPPEALSQKLHGPVVLQAVVGRDGSVQDLKIVRGYFVLGKAAIAAVKQWRFEPYTLNGHPVSTQTIITVNFSYPPS